MLGIYVFVLRVRRVFLRSKWRICVHNDVVYMFVLVCHDRDGGF